VIYILGLSHSGSTVLDMMLTTARKAVGLGQVWTVLAEEPEQRQVRTCSCGALAPECKIWGPVLEKLCQLPKDAALLDGYHLVLAQAAALYGSDIAVVDSSKRVEYLSLISNARPSLDIKVLHNLKDVRPFTISMLDNFVRKGRRRELPEKIFYQWYRSNRVSYDAATRVIGRPPLRVTYEGLCLSTEKVAARISETLGEDYIDTSSTLDAGYTHIISGNRTRLREEGKTKLLAYDYLWLSRSEWLRPYILMPTVRRYNERRLRELDSFVRSSSS
jgi:hypothetical protein